MQGEEVVGIGDLRGGVTLKRQTGVGLRHALTVVDHLYRGPSGIHHHHMDGRRTGIHRILYQFLDDGCRTLDDLTSSDLVGHTIGQQMNHITHFFGLQLKISYLLSGRI